MTKGTVARYNNQPIMTNTNAAPYRGSRLSSENRWWATPKQMTTRKNEMVASSTVNICGRQLFTNRRKGEKGWNTHGEEETAESRSEISDTVQEGKEGQSPKSRSESDEDERSCQSIIIDDLGVPRVSPMSRVRPRAHSGLTRRADSRACRRWHTIQSCHTDLNRSLV